MNLVVKTRINSFTKFFFKFRRPITREALSDFLYSLILSLLTVWIQVVKLPGSLAYVANDQQFRHLSVLEGTAGSPWAYRVTSEYVLKMIDSLLGFFGFSFTTSAITFRVLQNLLIFILLSIFISRFLSKGLSRIAMMIFAYVTFNSNWNSDLSFNVYSDILFALVFAILISDRKFWLCYPLLILAITNRETSLYLVLFMFAYIPKPRSRDFGHALGLMLVGLTTVLIVRSLIGFRAYMVYECCSVPFGYLQRNFEQQSLFFFSQSFLAVLAYLVISWTKVPRQFQRGLLLCIPWLVIHWSMTFVEETRLFLVPFTVIALPALLGTLMPQETHSNSKVLKRTES